MLKKSFPLEVKELDDAGTFVGFASVYGNVDSYGDIVMPGAFDRTMREKLYCLHTFSIKGQTSMWGGHTSIYGTRIG
jgi:phage head maturation protease